MVQVCKAEGRLPPASMTGATSEMLLMEGIGEEKKTPVTFVFRLPTLVVSNYIYIKKRVVMLWMKGYW